MNFFNDIIQPQIATATSIIHYPELNRFEFVDNNGKVLLSLYTEKNSQQLAIKYGLNTEAKKINRYYKYITILKIEL